MFALVTLTNWLTAVHTRRLTLESVVHRDPDEVARAIYELCDGMEYGNGANAEAASTRLVISISLSAPPVDSVSLDCVTAVASIDEFLRVHMCEKIEDLNVRLFVVEHGSAGHFTRSLPPPCIMPSSVVADGEGLQAVARRLCSKRDFREAEGLDIC